MLHEVEYFRETYKPHHYKSVGGKYVVVLVTFKDNTLVEYTVYERYTWALQGLNTTESIINPKEFQALIMPLWDFLLNFPKELKNFQKHFFKRGV